MIEKRDMKWALELAIQALDKMAKYHCHIWCIDNYRQAAEMLKNDGTMTEKSEIVKTDICTKCGFIYSDEQQKGYCEKCEQWSCKFVTCKKYWTEQEKIKTYIEKSKPTFKEIKQ